MKKYTSKILSIVLILGFILSNISGVNAMSEQDFKKSFLSQMALEDNISDEEIELISEELDYISYENILESISLEIESVKDTKLKKELEKELETLKKTEDGSKFFSIINNMYEKLDSYYEENIDILSEEFEDNFEYSFEKEKEEILIHLKEELNYISDKDFKKEISNTIEEIKNQKDENKFFDKLDILYTKLDEYYNEQYDQDNFEYNFEEDKVNILIGLKEEQKYISDETLKKEILNTIEEIKNQKDENKFFDALDKIYDKLDKYYQTNGIEVLSGEEFFSEDFDFESEKNVILEEVSLEILDIEDVTMKVKLEKELAELSSENNESMFFDKLYELYDKLDKYYESKGINLYEDEYEDGGIEVTPGEEFFSEDFESEKSVILEEISAEVSLLEDPIIKNELEKEITELSSEDNKNKFFDKLYKIYFKLDKHYENNGNEGIYDNEIFN